MKLKTFTESAISNLEKNAQETLPVRMTSIGKEFMVSGFSLTLHSSGRAYARR